MSDWLVAVLCFVVGMPVGFYLKHRVLRRSRG